MLKDSAKGIAVNACRFIVAATFIFSGYVKAIDPIGTQYKIHDYLAAVGLADMVPDYITLSASVALAALEFSLGIFLLFAIRRRLVSKLILAFMAVMTAITVWIAVANPVKDCGCFGDALILTNGQTLAKNIFLLAAAIAIWRNPTAMVRFIGRTNQWIAINYTIIYSLATSTYCLYTLPVFDFRPYHIGTDIPKAMEIPEGAEQPKFETTFTLKKNGITKEFTLDNYPDSTWTFVDSKTTQVSQGYVPPIHDFSMEDPTTGDDMTDDILSNPGYTFLLISPHLENADDTNFGNINQIYDHATAHHYRFVALTASNKKAIEKWTDTTGAEYRFLFSDETTLKTIIRSNPGMLLLKGGKVIQKWSHNELPDLNEDSPALDKTPEGHLPKMTTGEKIAYTILWFFLPLLLLTIADRMWAWTKWIRRRSSKAEQHNNPDSSEFSDNSETSELSESSKLSETSEQSEQSEQSESSEQS